MDAFCLNQHSLILEVLLTVNKKMRYLSIFLILFFLGCAADEEMDFSSTRQRK